MDLINELVQHLDIILAILSPWVGAAIFIWRRDKTLDFRQREIAQEVSAKEREIRLREQQEDRKLLRSMQEQMNMVQRELAEAQVVNAEAAARYERELGDLKSSLEKSRAEATRLMDAAAHEREVHQAELSKKDMELQKVVAEYKLEVNKLMDENTQLRDQVTVLTTDIQKLRERMDDVEQRAQRNEARAETLQQDLDDERRLRKQVETERDTLAERVASLEAKLEEKDTENAALHERLEAMQRELDSLRRSVNADNGHTNDNPTTQEA